MDYKTSGVDIEAGREFVSEIKAAVEKTQQIWERKACLEMTSTKL